MLAFSSYQYENIILFIQDNQIIHSHLKQYCLIDLTSNPNFIINIPYNRLNHHLDHIQILPLHHLNILILEYQLHIYKECNQQQGLN